jgi:hypothetical protein
MLRVVMLNVVELYDTMLDVIVLSDSLPSVVLLSVYAQLNILNCYVERHNGECCYAESR